MRTVVFRQGFSARRVEHHDGETILQTARRANIFINTNCVQGKCGTCACTLHRGRVAMRRNEALSEQDLEDGLILACQSVPVTDGCEIKLP